MVTVAQVLDVVAESLGCTIDVRAMQAEDALLGALPELDSIGIVGLITALESRFNIQFEDDDLDAEVFATVASLQTHINARVEPS
ncbi:MAG: acyl carrier protein [Gammaproteobacteria bacterium]|jgi:acyl carrier protein|nr:acyl carrier protein [Gammaproteobacteria bacterium]|tara:strand:- start:11935 stop:12189 length:255 start_codon:yes stop_codon:yes gene_type:complete